MSRSRLLALSAVAFLASPLPAAAELSQAALFAYNPSADLRLRTVAVDRRGPATVVDLLFDGGSGADVKAYLVVPEGPGPFAGVLWVHWLGEPETTNRTQYLPEAIALAPKGIASLLVDAMWSMPDWYAKRVPEEDFDHSRQVKDASTLFQFGTRDAYVSRADTAVLVGAASAPKERKLYDAEHDMSKPPEIAADRGAWLVKELVPAKP